MYQKDPKNVTQVERNRAKTFIYATMYGGTPESIVRGGAQGITRENTDIKVLKEMSDRLLLQFPVWVTWRKLMMKEARYSKLLRNVISGAPRIWFTSNGDAIEREAADYCGQGHAAVLMNRSHAEIERLLTQANILPGIILQGHDSLTAEVPVGRAEEAKQIIKTEMQRPILINKKEYTFPIDINTTEENWLVATKG
jgi:DNA polymerase I-like protein with 3'-5' exonuclease and polymerase domains